MKFKKILIISILLLVIPIAIFSVKVLFDFHIGSEIKEYKKGYDGVFLEITAFTEIDNATLEDVFSTINMQDMEEELIELNRYINLMQDKGKSGKEKSILRKCRIMHDYIQEAYHLFGNLKELSMDLRSSLCIKLGLLYGERIEILENQL